MNNPKEEWRPIEGHAGYEVSNLGNVRSIARIVLRRDGISTNYNGRMLIPWTNRKYSLVRLGAGRGYRVHILVCRAFNGPSPSAKHMVAHGDGNPGNNNAQNLRWATQKENKEDELKHGTRRFGIPRRGPKRAAYLALAALAAHEKTAAE